MIRRALIATAMAAAAAALASCNVNEYCVNCGADLVDGGDDVRDGAVDGGDGGGGSDACVPQGIEQCNGADDDCDGTTDEEVPQLDEPCGSDVGQCTIGVYVSCTDGELICDGVPASAEDCDGEDNDCDSFTDEGTDNQVCGTDLGECEAGVTVCQGDGTFDCVGDVGVPGAVAETCDGTDEDCDGVFDEDVPPGAACGFPDQGICEPGQMTCVGGAMQCVGGSGPAFELCDDIDQDCDGTAGIAEVGDFDFDHDVRNCGACGNSCIGDFDNAVAYCDDGDCAILQCVPGYYDDLDVPGADCLYQCDFQGVQEDCNGVDDDCDDVIDEDLIPPPICDTDGECAGTVATCTATGYDCVYTGDVSIDGAGNLIPETECDGNDNDCDGEVDESHPTVGDDCAGGTDVGICRDTGHLECDAANEGGPPVCIIDDLGDPAEATETCDGEDDDCDGVTDENPTAGREWVSIGGGREIMKYEASRPDALAGVEGFSDDSVCSKPGVQPWRQITQPDAEAVCAAIGARLCTEQEWHRACAGVAGTSYPVAGPGASPDRVFIQAEAFLSRSNATSGIERTWAPDYTAGYTGISALRATPDTGASISSGSAPTQSPRLTYTVNIPTTANHYIWVRMYSASGNADTLYVDITGTTTGRQQIVTPSNGSWVWVRAGSFNSVTAGNQTITLYMREDGLKVDMIMITRSTSTTAPTTPSDSNGGDWSFTASPDTYAGSSCNGEDNDTNAAVAGDQDDILNTGAKATCGASGVFDMSGNVKEWTAERLARSNPMRGGASNNEAGGITCSNAFALADDDFFFDNVGFRCCR